MKVLAIDAHHNPRSFCHAILERFGEGLRDAGHENDVVDLHAIRFDPVFSDRDTPDWVDDSVPDDVLAHWQVKKSLLAHARNPLPRLLVKRWIGQSTTASWFAGCTRWAPRPTWPSNRPRSREQMHWPSWRRSTSSASRPS
jgi:NAD(P)H dehydrogenase (quinone)